MRKQEGITLISLVLTIIVMLILAGVTISLTLGENRNIYNSSKSGTKLYAGTKPRNGSNRGFYQYSR